MEPSQPQRIITRLNEDINNKTDKQTTNNSERIKQMRLEQKRLLTCTSDTKTRNRSKLGTRTQPDQDGSWPVFPGLAEGNTERGKFVAFKC